MPDLYIIAGPNGAGKTTAALQFLPQNLGVFEYVNVDEIARGLNPLKPETANFMAGRVALARLHSLLNVRADFGFETTLAGTSHTRFLQKCRDNGYIITLAFLYLPSSELAVRRVQNRVKQKGHNIPEDDVRRRYHKGLVNLVNVYLPLCDRAIVLDNARPLPANPELIVEKKQKSITVHNTSLWESIISEAKRA